jgi:RNA polymerase sigma-70 factor (ECF subfamily)
MNPTKSQAETLDRHDSTLVALAKVGNTPAVNRLASKYWPEAYRAAARIMRCHEDAEEVAQDALWAAINHLSTFREDASFRTWLHQIVIQRSLMALRRKSAEAVAILGAKSVEALPPSASSRRTPEQLLLEVEDRTVVNEALLRLPDCYSVVLLFAYEGRSRNEIAAFLGISTVAVKARLHRARMLLRREMRRRLCLDRALNTGSSRKVRPVQRGTRIDTCRLEAPAPAPLDAHGSRPDSGCPLKARAVVQGPGAASACHLTSADGDCRQGHSGGERTKEQRLRAENRHRGSGAPRASHLPQQDDPIGKTGYRLCLCGYHPVLH